MKNFQLIITIIFIALAVFGVLVFSGAIPIGKDTKPGALGTVVLWGTVGGGIMNPLMEKFNEDNPTIIVKYVPKNIATLDQDLLEALAGGSGPDMFFVTDDLAFHFRNKIFTIPYTSYSVASFKSNFSSASDVFLTSNGMLAFPIAIDPLVMYYDRSILDSAGIVFPPTTWDDLVGMIPKLTMKDDANKISRSTIALGGFSNVTHAKDILTALFMQTGNTIVKESNNVLLSDLDNLSNTSNNNLSSMLKFYTSFADPAQDVYSWNKSFLNSRDAFSRGTVAFYLGFSSELASLINTNPNQNFGVVSIPQIKGASFKATSSHITGIAIFSSSANLSTAFTAANLLSTGDFASGLTTATGIIPARRDLLNNKPTDAFLPIMYNSALYAKSWLDPSPSDTNNIFSDMIEGVLSNSVTILNAISSANGRLSTLLR